MQVQQDEAIQNEQATDRGDAVSEAQAQQVEALKSLWATKSPVTLFGDYNYVYLTATELRPAMTAFYDLIYGADQMCDVNVALTEEEKASRSNLTKRIESVYQLYLGIFARDQFIGWCWGRQESPEEFHMVNTSLLAEYRGRGIYSALLPEVLKIVGAEGFQSVISWHHPNNTGILVPKLKAGFVISGFRVWDRFGLLVQLAYPFNETRRELFSYRIGCARISDRTAPLFD